MGRGWGRLTPQLVGTRAGADWARLVGRGRWPGRLPALHQTDKGVFTAGVYIVKRKHDVRKCVEKRFRPKEILSEAVKFEIFVVRDLNHKHITEYIDSFIEITDENPRASLYLKYCDLGTLADTLQRRRTEKKPLKEWGVRELFIQLTNAVAYCRDGIHDAVFEPNGKIDTPWSEIIHRDIKPANIFLRTDCCSTLPQVVLGDFGQDIRRVEEFRRYHILVATGDI